MFFFISSYGMTRKVKIDKEIYLKNFFRKRILKLLIPVIIITILHIILNILIFKKFYSINSIINIYKNVSSIINNGWYLNSILVIYLIYYLCFKLFKNIKFSYIFFTVLVITYIYFLNEIGFGIWWYNSMLALLFGMYYEIFEYKIKSLLNKNITKILLIISILSFYVLNNSEIKIINFVSKFGIAPKFYIVQNLICINFIIMILLITFVNCNFNHSKFALLRNKILSFLGKISFEIYMLHGLIINILLLFLNLNILFIFLLFSFTIVFAYIFNSIFKNLYKILC